MSKSHAAPFSPPRNEATVRACLKALLLSREHAEAELKKNQQTPIDEEGVSYWSKELQVINSAYFDLLH